MNEAGVVPHGAIRFGLICEGTLLPSWQVRCIDELLKVEGVKLSLLIIDPSSGEGDRTRAKTVLAARDREAVWLKYERIAMRRSEAFRHADLSDVFSGTPTIEGSADPWDATNRQLSEDDLRKVADHDLDFILRLGSGGIRGSIASAARMGVWSFRYGDGTRFRGDPPCFWEMFHGEPIMGATLECITGSAENRSVLRKAYLRTNPRSYVRSREAIAEAGVHWPAEVCRNLRSGIGVPEEAAPVEPPTRLRGYPTATQTARFVWRTWRRLVTDVFFHLLAAAQWNVGVIQAPIHSFLELADPPSVTWLPEPPKGRYIADPFGIASEESDAVLVEEFDRRKGGGRIVALTGVGGVSLRMHPSIPLRTHASYPFFIEHEGVAYCVPETVDAKEAALYRAEGWPTWPPEKWVRTATLVEGFPVVDPSLALFGDRWWLFCTNLDDQPDAKLLIWHAPDLFGPWQPHPANPVKTDVRSARSGGTPFVWKGQLFRPAQDCSTTYGGRVIINRVTELTETRFAEEEAAAVGPFSGSRYPLGLHTLSALGDKTLVDGKRRVLTSAESLQRDIRTLTQRRRRVPGRPSVARGRSGDDPS